MAKDKITKEAPVATLPKVKVKKVISNAVQTPPFSMTINNETVFELDPETAQSLYYELDEYISSTTYY